MKLKRGNNIILLFLFIIIVVYYDVGPNVFKVISDMMPKAFVKSPFIKYVLIWIPGYEPLSFIREGNETFYKRNCAYKNCYVILNKRQRFLDVTEFDAILIDGPRIVSKPTTFLPRKRLPNQSYIFTSLESSDNYKVPDRRYDGVFNFTWTYKLDSNISFAYMVIRDKEDNIIGPNEAVDWINIDGMLPTSDNVIAKLADKNIAAAWFVSNCNPHSERKVVADMVIAELKKYNMSVDVYGKCGNKKCPRYSKECLEKLQRDYYFYFAFENSFSEDYVTEKLLNPLQNYAVPIVYEAADYSRFMPDGIYLSVALDPTAVEELVKEMVDSIRDKKKYYNYFKWHNHYSYHDPQETPATDPYCAVCTFLNQVDHSKVSVVDNFYEWWNPDVYVALTEL